MSDTKRGFGVEIENTMPVSEMIQEDAEIVLEKSNKHNISRDSHCSDTSMEKPNGVESSSKNLLSNALAVEIYSLVNHNTSSFEDLIEEIEDLLDDGFYIGEHVYHAGKEYVVKSKEKHGGLTMYTMLDGSKIGHREIRRKKGLNIDYIKERIKENSTFDGKCWKVNDDVKSIYQLKEKLAPIFCKNTPRKSLSVEESDDDDTEPQVLSERRASGRMPANVNRKSLQAAQKKAKVKEEKEAQKQKEKEEKKKAKEEAKMKKMEEKEEKKRKDKENGMEKFLKKGNSSANESTASIFSPTSSAKAKKDSILKKMEDAWNIRDQTGFKEVCSMAAKSLNENQIKTIENPIFQFAVKKCCDKNKDTMILKHMKAEKRQQYRDSVAEERKELYKKMEPQIKHHFSEDFEEEDLLIYKEPLILPSGAIEVEVDEELMQCLEITQFYAAFCKILAFNENITAQQLKTDAHLGFEGFQRSAYKILLNLAETCIQEDRYKNVRFKRSRLREYPVNEFSITELIRSLFLGFTTNKKTDRYEKEDPTKEEIEDEEEEDDEEVLDLNEEEEFIDDDYNYKHEILALFTNNDHIYEWEPANIIKLMHFMMKAVISLPIIREWHFYDVTNDQLTQLRNELAELNETLATHEKTLKTLPEIVATKELENLTRNESRKLEMQKKKREKILAEIEKAKERIEVVNSQIADELEMQYRAFRTVIIGYDRHFRKYYWFVNNDDAGIWIEDFGTTPFENFLHECRKNDIEIYDAVNDGVPLENMKTGNKTAKFFKICDEASIKELEAKLGKRGVREKSTKKFLNANMKDIIGRLSTPKSISSESQSRSATPEADEEMDTSNVFEGAYHHIKTGLKNMADDLTASKLTTMSNSTFGEELEQATTLDDIKELFVNMVMSIRESSIIVKYPHLFAIEKKLTSHLYITAFMRNVRQVRSESALHLLLGYLESRIDFMNGVMGKKCAVCRRSSNWVSKLQCSQCMYVVHYRCLRSNITKRMMEELRENWTCAKCIRDNRRKQISSNGENAQNKNEEERADLRPRSAKRKATEAIHDSIEASKRKVTFRRKKEDPLPEVKEMFDSVEPLNPRLYKLLVTIEPYERETRSSPGVLGLKSIEEDLDLYKSTDELKRDLLHFFHSARNYLETHNSRKLRDLDLLISEFDS